MLTLVVFFGFVLQQYVMVDMLWPEIRKRLVDRQIPASTLLSLELAFRALLVMVASMILVFKILLQNWQRILDFGSFFILQSHSSFVIKIYFVFKIQTRYIFCGFLPQIFFAILSPLSWFYIADICMLTSTRNTRNKMFMRLCV